MTDLTGVFGSEGMEAAAAEYSSGGSALPPGKYLLRITEAEMKDCKNDGKGILFTFEDDNEAKVTNWLNIVNNGDKKELVERIGRAELAKIAVCAGVKDLTTTDQLVGLQLVVKLELVDNEFTNKKGEKIKNKKNLVKGYFPASEPVGAIVETKTTETTTGNNPWS